ncbi:hypothetical protein AGLY_003429 [Aphis glycines]|uniref:Reverse transcriptase domain-containing protein n=1 Tax=Aphis glycines TaxID=307491 RepID=A0A6G0U1Y6_APHGL|nr:hypothetical protein AGLY_003429 [Aphis glycines]
MNSQLDLIFSNITNTIVSKCNEELVPADVYHPVLEINCEYVMTSDSQRDESYKYNFKREKFNLLTKTLFNSDWSNVYSSGCIDFSTNEFYRILSDVINKLVPKYTFRNTLNNQSEVVNAFSDCFFLVYEKPISLNNFVLSNVIDWISINILDISTSEVFDSLTSMKCASSPGHDSIQPILLHNCRWALTKPLHHLFNLSLKSGTYPETWKISFVSPIWKSGDRSSVSNYRPISKMNIIPKLFEKIIEPKLIYLFSNVLIN